MKRVICALIIVILTLGISIASLLDMKVSLASIAENTRLLRQESEVLPAMERTERCRELMKQWEGMEGRFLLYVRHDHLDNIMEHLSELPAFSEKEDQSELLSNLDAATRMMEHLWESVKPSYRTLL